MAHDKVELGTELLVLSSMPFLLTFLRHNRQSLHGTYIRHTYDIHTDIRALVSTTSSVAQYYLHTILRIRH